MSLITVEVESKVGWLVLNRPDKLNALSPEMMEEFDVALRQLSENEDVSVIVIRGEGRSFSVGYDVSRHYDSPEETPYSLEDSFAIRSRISRWLRVWQTPVPVIAAVQGHCLAGAMLLALCCDITVVARDAKIGGPKLPLGGGMIGPSNSWLLGTRKARELSYVSGSSITGEEAVALGWANHAVDAGELVEFTARMASVIARTPRELLALKKRALNRVMDSQGFTESLLTSAEFDALAHHSRAVSDVRAMVESIGLRDAIKQFEAGGLG
ncbi:MAG: enoyl-CoA hydratase/isomerase family protein [Actinobacteria bacterium]|nr:enoyl-CoA hydratase/isomerase family protein [Actinomycetota bacterium]